VYLHIENSEVFGRLVLSYWVLKVLEITGLFQ